MGEKTHAEQEMSDFDEYMSKQKKMIDERKKKVQEDFPDWL